MRSRMHRAAALAALLVVASARVSFAVACGDTITTAETLTGNLDCPGAPVLTIGAGGSLDMNGFQVTCNGGLFGIVMLGDGASLSNGSVGNCSSSAIELYGDKQKLTGVYVFNANVGVYASGAAGLKITDCAAANVGFAGFSIGGDGSSLTGISVLTTTNMGLYVTGGHVKLKDTTVAAVNAESIYMFGDNSQISDARLADGTRGLSFTGGGGKIADVHAVNYTQFGIMLTGTKSKLGKSTAATSSGTAQSIYLQGTGLSLGNSATLGGQDGIALNGSGRKAGKNCAFGAQRGIHASGSGFKITGNLGLGSSTTDFVDDAPACESGNSWKKNVGKTGQACID